MPQGVNLLVLECASWRKRTSPVCTGFFVSFLKKL